MDDDHLEEEMQIAQEQDSGGTTLSSATFQEPISNVLGHAPITLDENTSISEAVTLMQAKRIGSIVILGGDQKLVGIVTERDILMKVIGLMEDWRNRPISEIMTANPETLLERDMIAFALNNMHVGGYRHVPIVNEEGIPVRIISSKDLVGFILDHFPEEITNITSQPYRGKPSREGA